MKPFLIRWLATSSGVLAASALVGEIHLGSFLGALLAVPLAGLLLTLFNTSVRPWLLAVSLPLVIRTMGFFYLVLNVLLLKVVGWMVGWIVPGFAIYGISGAVWGSIWIGLVSFGVNLWLNPAEGGIRFSGASILSRRPEPPPPEAGPEIKAVKGRVIEP